MWKRLFKTWKIYHLINKAVEFKKKSRKKLEVNKGHPNRNIQWMNQFAYEYCFYLLKISIYVKLAMDCNF